MEDDELPRPTRRTVLRTTAGVAGSALTIGAMGRARAQERPDFGEWLNGVDGGFVDARGEDEVTVLVGAAGNSGSFAFDPAGLWIDPGTTVIWEWTGDGGGHNVRAQSGGEYGTDVMSEAGVTYSYTFEETGISTYQCDPHVSLGMKGAIAVGEVATTSSGSTTEGGLTLPGGTAGGAVVLTMLGTTSLAVLAALSGEFSDLLDRRTDGPDGAYRMAAGALGIGTLFIAIVTLRLLVGA